MRIKTTTVISLLALAGIFVAASEATTLESIEAGLARSVDFYRNRVAVHGGYVWQCSADLAKREGEGKVSPTEIWVQPPGTPSVGEAFLDAYEATKQPDYLNAAKDCATALVRGQLVSGGWDYRIDFDPGKRKNIAYRVEPERGVFNVSTLDDNTTQAALSFLIRLDKALNFADSEIHAAAWYGLDKLIAAQYPNGAWPQRFSQPPDPNLYPVIKASYPESWSREFVKRDYRNDYTFNDNTIADTIRLMLFAHTLYGDPKYRESALRAGDFILLAQMPEPQPAWAQQYDAQMHPVWARKFEPPAISGGESQGVMRTLLHLFHQTGETRFLDPIPKALAYLRASQLPDGRLARFYELKTNTPLYFTRDYVLTYSADDLPTHYAFIVASGLDAIEAAYEDARTNGPRPIPDRTAVSPEEAMARAEIVLNALDERGAWVEQGRMTTYGEDDATREVIRSMTFIRNVEILCDAITAVKESPSP